MRIVNKSEISSYISFKLHYMSKPQLTSFYLTSFQKNAKDDNVINFVGRGS